MYIQFWRKRAYIRCHSIQSTMKKGINVAKGNVSHGEPKMGKMVRRRDLLCVRRSWSLHRGRVVRDAVQMPKARKKK
jgi:hypothetical protein